MWFKGLCGGLFLAAIVSSASVDTRLADAAQQDNKAAVNALLAQKIDVNQAQGDGMTALHWAASNDDLEMVRALLMAGANVKAETRIGAVTPIFMACRNGNASIIEELLKAGASASAPDGHGTTPLMIAAAAGGTDAVKVLLDHGADVNAKETSHEQTALMFAAAYNRAEVIKVLIARGADAKITSKAVDPGCGSVFDVDGCVEVDENGDPVDEHGKVIAPKEKDKDKTDGKPTADSAEIAELQARVQELTEQVNELKQHPNDKQKKSAAADDGKAASAKKKRERRGATIMGGMTALLFAARDGHLEAARALVESGVDINDPGAGEKLTPMVMAISNGHYDLAKYLLDHGADPKLASESSGLTALYAAIDMQWAPYAWLPQPIAAQEKTTYLDLMKALLEHGADPNARLKKRVWFRALPDDSTWVDPAGATPFWRAAQSDDLAAMRLLVEHGANPWIATTQGDTPLMVAVGLGWALNFSRNAPDSWMPAAKYLLVLDADVNAVDEKGYTALHGASFRGDDEMIQFLVKSGAKVDVKTKKGDTVADMANGPFHHSIPHPETIALLEKLGSANSHNCRSDQCVPEVDEGQKKAVADASASAKPAAKTVPK
jgi:uncharacterized protein